MCRQLPQLCVLDVMVLVLLLGNLSRNTPLASETLKYCVFMGSLDLDLMKSVFSPPYAEAMSRSSPSGVIAFADLLLAAPPPRVSAALEPNSDQNRLSLRENRERSRKLQNLSLPTHSEPVVPAPDQQAVYEYRPTPTNVKQILSQNRKRHVDNPELPIAFLSWLSPPTHRRRPA